MWSQEYVYCLLVAVFFVVPCSLGYETSEIYTQGSISHRPCLRSRTTHVQFPHREPHHMPSSTAASVWFALKKTSVNLCRPCTISELSGRFLWIEPPLILCIQPGEPAILS